MASNNSSLSRRAWSSSNTLSGGVNEHASPSQSKTFANNSVPILCDSEVESNDEEEEQACSRFVAIIKNDEHKESLELSEDRPKASIKSWFVQSAKCINKEDVENTEGVKLSKDQVKRFQKSGNREKFYEDECTDQASLQKLLKTNPALYKRCHLQIDSAHRSVAKVLDGKDSKCTEIAIIGRSKCGRSYNEDEVVVKVLDPADQRLGSRTAPCDMIAEKTNAQTITHGQVIGRLKRVRYANVDHPVLICTLDEIEGHLMKPICKTVPKIHVLNDTVRRENPALVKHCIEIKEISSNGWVKFKRIVNIEASKREQYVFKVAILAWRQESIYPLGVVLEIHAAGRDYAGGLKVLYMQQRVPTTYPLRVVRHTRSLLQSKIKKRMKGRRDLSDKQVFTIDPPTAEDLDDALSVWKEKGHFVVGVHIADVAELIKERTNTDMEARKRGVTFYPLDRKPHPMLPEPISHGICSLLSNKRRLTLSVFFTFDSHFKLLETIEPKVEKTVIKSKRQFSYEEVQKIINGTQTKDINDSLSTDIHRLHKIASNLSESRKQNSRMYVPFEDPRLEDLHTVYNSLEAHALVEEFMILTNVYIAKRLSSTFPELMILRCQKAPTYDSLTEWRKKQNSIGDLVMQLQGKKITPETRLSISNPELSSMTLHPTHVFVQEDLWRMLCQSMKSGNIPKARKLAFMDSLHPLQCLATHQWMEMMESAEYKCSHGLNQPDHLHYGLDLSHYTHFTSPLRRYVDLHVQRLLHADLDGRTPECTTDNVQQLCLHINGVTARQKAFERGCMALKIADGLQNRPLTFRAYVQHVDTEQLTLCVPSLQAVADRKQELPFSVLGVSSQPVLTADIVSVTWNMRIYNALASTQEGQEGHLLSEKHVRKERRKTFPSSADISINRHQLSVCVKQSNWAQILTSLITSEQCQGVDWQSLKEEDESGEKRISSEEGDGTLSSRPGRFKMAYSTGLVLQIQMTSEPCKGLLKPRVELMHIARNITVCLRHVKDPVTALARFATRTTRRQTFTCYDDYVRAWMPLLEMEAACGAGNSDSTVVVENVHIFMNEGGKAGSDYLGHFQLPYKFCFDRDIEFGGGLYDDLDEGEPSCPVGYLCIRYRLKCDTATVSRVQQSDLETCIDDHYTWVGHASITSVKHKHRTADDGGVMHVKFILNEKNPQPPHEMTSSKGEIVMIEILQKSEVDKRAQKMLLQLDSKEESLAQSIAYGSDFPSLDEDHLRLGSDSRYHEVESALFTKKFEEGKEAFGLPRNNPPQRKAIKTALKHTLSLIQGPPGTGKTYTGIKLVYLFSKINRQLAEKSKGKGEDKERKIVLYCGPSNKSVDLVARLLKQRLGDRCPKILRVYGSAIESKDYPVPRGNLRSSRSMRDLKSDLSLQDVTLHHIIRDENPHAEEIVSFDKIFERCLKDPEKFKVTSTQLKEYYKLLFEASVEEISKGYEVILTTCAVAGSRRIIRGTNGNIFQVIIDECAMSPEPHCLVPIIANKAKQVVLIGDHKQLRPIIKCQPAAELGLDQSLFKRLFKNLQENLKVFLSDQYRMHKKICEFPSEVFYKGKLKTKTHWKSLGFWPREKRTGREVPHILIDVRGEEETLTVSSDEGNERSKSNKMEAEKVVEVFKFLKKEFNVETSTIRVLTQYNAQRHLLEQKLLTLCDDREENVFSRYDKAKLKVTTVVSSQGSESDYVILSTVRSLPSFKIEPRPTYGWCRQNLGFITDRNQVNVALTRAKFGLIIVGNIELLHCDAVWRQLIERYRDEGCIYGCDEFPPRLSQPTPSLQRMQSDGRTRFR